MNLPIHEVIDAIQEALSTRDELIIEAPPGAGKTTIVPLELLKNAPWLTGKILLLEPRRMAARAVAQRMAQLLGEEPGARVGYRIRQQTRISPRTQIEVVTGGVLLRMLQQDPSLAGYDVVIFDEFHERNLDSDFALSLCLHSRPLFREADCPLKLVVMSATLDGEQIARYVDHAPIIRSEGRRYPVDIVYLGECPRAETVARTIECVVQAHHNHPGNILVFLPGQREIQQCQAQLAHRLPASTAIFPLYGALPLEQQLRAIEALDQKAGFDRKLVLATDIAETSLTIEGITLVVDSCLHRSPAFDHKTGLTRLTTQRISRASATQRSGRAGRLAPGTCYRLLSQATTLSAHSAAEITQADLAPLVLQMFSYGVNSPDELTWLDSPPPAAYQNAVRLLRQLGAFKQDGAVDTLSAHGEELSRVTTHPRLAHMILAAQPLQLGREACFLAAALTEPGRPPELGNQIDHWLNFLPGSTTRSPSPWLQRVWRQSDEFAKNLCPQPRQQPPKKMILTPAGLLLAMAYPDRIARRRDLNDGSFLLSNGRAARVDSHHPLNRHPWICIAETGAHQTAKDDRIFAAASLDEQDIRHFLANLITPEHCAFWDHNAQRFIAEQRLKIGAILLATQKLSDIDPGLRQQAICQYICESDFTALNWTLDCEQLCQRVNTLRRVLDDPSEQFPDCTPSALKHHADIWLTPYLGEVRTAQDLGKLDVVNLLKNYLTWPKLQILDRLVPSQIKVPSGFFVDIDYRHWPPILEVKLQEMFGCAETPTLVDGRLRLSLHLLSPARRPLQITQDLAGFWQGSYKEVQKEMKGRYPKHPWPDDPQQASATRFTKKRAGLN